MSGERSRDDFSPSVKEILAKKSGYICAYPGCKQMTVARSDDRKSSTTMIGIAAHITAASKNGPRYDPNMSKVERASESNGIWTCLIHGKFIDDNPSKCTVEELRRWKFQHEKWVFEHVESGKEQCNEGISRIVNNELHQVENLFATNSPLDILIKKSTPLDLEILKAIRNYRADTQQIEHLYQIYSRGIDTFNQSFIQSCIKTINSSAVEVNSDPADILVELIPRKKIRFIFEEKSITLNNPKLLWECNCKIKYPKEYKKKNVPFTVKFQIL